MFFFSGCAYLHNERSKNVIKEVVILSLPLTHAGLYCYLDTYLHFTFVVLRQQPEKRSLINFLVVFQKK
jgi:hypothetical protein